MEWDRLWRRCGHTTSTRAGQRGKRVTRAGRSRGCPTTNTTISRVSNATNHGNRRRKRGVLSDRGEVDELRADESKAHFDQMYGSLGELDLLLVIIWAWNPIDRNRVSPVITDHFIGPARPIAALRDKLHVARGGSFVDRSACADHCKPAGCTHHGEPLNAAGKRERLSGPEALRPSAKVSFAANFGGLMRMLKTNSNEARKVFNAARAQDGVAHEFISFMHRNFPREEENTYSIAAWRAAAATLGINTAGLSADVLIERVRASPNYMTLLRAIE